MKGRLSVGWRGGLATEQWLLVGRCISNVYQLKHLKKEKWLLSVDICPDDYVISREPVYSFIHLSSWTWSSTVICLWYSSVERDTAKGSDWGDVAAERWASLNTSRVSNMNLRSERQRGNVRISYLGSVSFGIFVDFCQGQVGVEFVPVLLQDGQRTDCYIRFWI